MDANVIFSTTVALLQGLGVVLLLFFIVLAASMPLGFLMTLIMKSKNIVLRCIIGAYVYLIRATPLMLQLFFIYYGLPFIHKSLTFSAITAALIGFTLNYSAYFAEIFRGGLLSIDKGQFEAAKVLGMSRSQTLFKVTLQQMFRVALPSITNESITLIKDTALVFSISVPEIIYYAKAAVSRTGNIYPYVIAFVIYLVINSLLQWFFNWLERKTAY